MERLTTKKVYKENSDQEMFTSTMSLKTELIEYGYMPEVKLSNFQACIKYKCMFANLIYMSTVHLFMWVHF